MSDQQRDREQRDTRQTLEAWMADFREAFRRGDKFALLECVMFCANSELALPRWALVELASAAYKYASGKPSENFHDAIFGARKRFGRHSQAATKRRDELKHQVWFDIVWALRQQGYKGDRLYEQARIEIGRGFAILPDGELQFSACPAPKAPNAETLKKTVGRLRKKKVRPKFAFAFMPCGPLPTRPASA